MPNCRVVKRGRGPACRFAAAALVLAAVSCGPGGKSAPTAAPAAGGGRKSLRIAVIPKGTTH